MVNMARAIAEMYYGPRRRIVSSRRYLRADRKYSLRICSNGTPGGGPPLHLQMRHKELFFVLEGEISFRLNGREIGRAACGTAFVHRGVPHCFKNCSHKRARVRILFTPRDIRGSFGYGKPTARAVHTKGVVLEGVFTPAPEARTIVKTSIFSGGPLPIVARFSVFAGLPDLPDNADGASPARLGVKIKSVDGDDFDIEANQHRDFITATFDEFAVFLRALGATKPDTPHPNPVEQFLATHPHAEAFLESLTYPVSYAEAKYFGINAVKFTNAAGRSVFVRYQFVPRAGEHYLTPEQRKAESASYLQDEILQRVGREPIVFDWYAQIAERGDAIADPSTAWPDPRKLVKLERSQSQGG